MRPLCSLLLSCPGTTCSTVPFRGFSMNSTSNSHPRKMTRTRKISKTKNATTSSWKKISKLDYSAQQTDSNRKSDFAKTESKAIAACWVDHSWTTSAKSWTTALSSIGSKAGKDRSFEASRNTNENCSCLETLYPLDSSAKIEVRFPPNEVVKTLLVSMYWNGRSNV